MHVPMVLALQGLNCWGRGVGKGFNPQLLSVVSFLPIQLGYTTEQELQEVINQDLPSSF